LISNNVLCCEHFATGDVVLAIIVFLINMQHQNAYLDLFGKGISRIRGAKGSAGPAAAKPVPGDTKNETARDKTAPEAVL